jgi:hypothetical protein
MADITLRAPDLACTGLLSLLLGMLVVASRFSGDLEGLELGISVHTAISCTEAGDETTYLWIREFDIDILLLYARELAMKSERVLVLVDIKFGSEGRICILPGSLVGVCVEIVDETEERGKGQVVVVKVLCVK